MFVCANWATKTRNCVDRFDESRLIGLHFDSAERLASKHGLRVRREAPLGPNEGLTADKLSNRIDIECDSTAASCVVVRILGTG